MSTLITPASLELSHRLLLAVGDCLGQHDARDVCRRLVGEFAQASSAPIVSLQVALPAARRFATLGVLGFPHFASTLLVPLAWEPLQPYIHAPQPLWLRDRDEKQACVNALTGPHTDRADGVSAIVGDRSRHLLFSPLTRGDQVIGSLLLGSGEGGFRAHHVELCRVLARAAACALRNITRATVFDEHGKTHVIDCLDGTEIPTTATPAAPAAGDLPTGPASPHLTGRQRDILWSLFAGKSNAQIAEDLTLSVHTVRTHRRHLLTAFDAHSSAELLAKARAAGVAPLT